MLDRDSLFHIRLVACLAAFLLLHEGLGSDLCKQGSNKWKIVLIFLLQIADGQSAY